MPNTPYERSKLLTEILEVVRQAWYPNYPNSSIVPDWPAAWLQLRAVIEPTMTTPNSSGNFCINNNFCDFQFDLGGENYTLHSLNISFPIGNVEAVIIKGYIGGKDTVFYRAEASFEYLKALYRNQNVFSIANLVTGSITTLPTWSTSTISISATTIAAGSIITSNIVQPNTIIASKNIIDSLKLMSNTVTYSHHLTMRGSRLNDS